MIIIIVQTDLIPGGFVRYAAITDKRIKIISHSGLTTSVTFLMTWQITIAMIFLLVDKLRF